MKKYLVLICLVFAGCVSVEKSAQQGSLGPKEPLTNIKQVRVGMTLQEVKNIMGDHSIVGYNFDNEKQTVEPMTLNSPYRSEELKIHGQKYPVLYYFTDVEKADGIVADDELTALIFEDGKLIGKGKDFLFNLKVNK